MLPKHIERLIRFFFSVAEVLLEHDAEVNYSNSAGKNRSVDITLYLISSNISFCSHEPFLSSMILILVS